jgi:hypothetical protein
MSLKDDHEQRVAAFPADVREAHQHSSQHRDEILASAQCGCFHCCAAFPPEQIVEWTDDDGTAVCPRCGIDSVIGDRSGFPVSRAFLSSMRAHWFGEVSGDT